MKTMHKAKVIDGVALAGGVQERIQRRVAALRELGRAVRLDAVRVGGDDAAAIYARNQAKICRKVDIEHVLHDLLDVATVDRRYAIAGRGVALDLALPEQPVRPSCIQARRKGSGDHNRGEMP